MWQPSLLTSGGEVAIDETFRWLTRINLDERAWVDYAPEWVKSSDELYDELLRSLDWGQRSRRMYDKRVREPRLTAGWRASSGTPLTPPILEDMRKALSARYGVELDSVGFNLYRDGRDSVAWHGDHIEKAIEKPVVALVSLGDLRKFLLRPRGGGASKAFMLGRGDLLVTGGSCQRTWEHSVPKVSEAGPRMSLAFRHGLRENAYSHKRREADVEHPQG